MPIVNSNLERDIKIIHELIDSCLMNSTTLIVVLFFTLDMWTPGTKKKLLSNIWLLHQHVDSSGVTTFRSFSYSILFELPLEDILVLNELQRNWFLRTCILKPYTVSPSKGMGWLDSPKSLICGKHDCRMLYTCMWRYWRSASPNLTCREWLACTDHIWLISRWLFPHICRIMDLYLKPADSQHRTWI